MKNNKPSKKINYPLIIFWAVLLISGFFLSFFISIRTQAKYDLSITAILFVCFMIFVFFKLIQKLVRKYKSYKEQKIIRNSVVETSENKEQSTEEKNDSIQAKL